MSTVLTQNLRNSIRSLFRSPGFSSAATLTLALGIGATSAILCIVYAVFEPRPYAKPDQPTMVCATNKGSRNSASTADCLEWEERNLSFQSMGAWTGGPVMFNYSMRETPIVNLEINQGC